MRRDLSAIMALACVGAMVETRSTGLWQAPTLRQKQRPHIQRMVGGTDAEINAWNEAVELRRAIKKGTKP